MFERLIDGPVEAEHVYQVTLDSLTSLEEIGRDVRPESSLPYIRSQVIYNVTSLINGERPPIRTENRTDALSLVFESPDPG